MTTNKSGSVNQLPLYVCTGCIGSYEDCTWLAGDLRVHDGDCWCDPCWYMRRFEFPDLPEWEDLEPYTPALQVECEKLRKDAERYRWLRDNGHLNIWWSVEGPEDRCDNIDADIDEAMNNPPTEREDGHE